MVSSDTRIAAPRRGRVRCASPVGDAPLGWVVFAAGVAGAGFGLSWAFSSQRILGDLEGDERTIGGAGIATVRL